MIERLTNSHFVILRSIFKRSGGRPVVLEANWQREFVPRLLRRGLIEVWNRQVVGSDFALRGPFLTLTIAGERLAASFFNRAPRRFSGAGEVR